MVHNVPVTHMASDGLHITFWPLLSAVNFVIILTLNNIFFNYQTNGINLNLVFWQYSLYPFNFSDKTFSSLRILNIRETGRRAKGISPQYDPSAIGVGINIISTPMYIG